MKKIFLLSFVTFLTVQCKPGGHEREREDMVRTQIIARGVQDTATLRALRTVQRHEFVPSELADLAYADCALPIGHKQTISQPYIVAVMTELVKPHKGQRVLEIGTGSGYQAAVLAEIVDTVYTIEIIPELATFSSERLKHLGYYNIIVRQGDGFLGWRERAPFDAIVVTAAAEEIPKPLVEQLKEGGVMVIPVGSVESVQSLTLVKKQGNDVVTIDLLPVRFVPLIHSR